MSDSAQPQGIKSIAFPNKVVIFTTPLSVEEAKQVVKDYWQGKEIK